MNSYKLWLDLESRKSVLQEEEEEEEAVEAAAASSMFSFLRHWKLITQHVLFSL